MTEISSFAAKLKAKAFFWAETHTGLAPQNRWVRVAMAVFSNLASELSHQLESRADAFQLQTGLKIKATELPLSRYLRNAEPTDFLNLYTWNRAAAFALWEDMLLRPNVAFSSEETADRVRVIERLFADHNWGKVNTVYGSGQGKFAMALVKDELGNWNLKSFESDPSDLVEAYTGLVLAAIDKAGDALTSGALPPETLSLGRGINSAGIGGKSDTFHKDRLRRRLFGQLQTIDAEATKKHTELTRQSEELNHKAETVGVKATQAKDAADRAESRTTSETCATERACEPQKTVEDARKALNEALTAKFRIQNITEDTAADSVSVATELVAKAVEHVRDAEARASNVQDPSEVAARAARLSAEKSMAYAEAATAWTAYSSTLAEKERVTAALSRLRVETADGIRKALSDYGNLVATFQEFLTPSGHQPSSRNEQTLTPHPSP